MHESVRAWVEYVFESLNVNDRILEVGSANVNGSVREMFNGNPYVGIDLDPGPGVDVVMDAHHLVHMFGPDSFEIVLCLEMLEHDPNPWVTLQQIGQVLAPGGALVLTCRGNGFKEHNNPDLWRFMADGMKLLVEQSGLALAELEPDPQVPGWFVLAMKPVVD